LLDKTVADGCVDMKDNSQGEGQEVATAVAKVSDIGIENQTFQSDHSHNEGNQNNATTTASEPGLTYDNDSDVLYKQQPAYNTTLDEGYAGTVPSETAPSAPQIVRKF